MVLASVPCAFQCLDELVLKGISNVVVYIDDLIQAWARFETEPKLLQQNLETFETAFFRLPGKSSVQSR